MGVYEIMTNPGARERGWVGALVSNRDSILAERAPRHMGQVIHPSPTALISTPADLSQTPAKIQTIRAAGKRKLEHCLPHEGSERAALNEDGLTERWLIGYKRRPTVRSSSVQGVLPVRLLPACSEHGHGPPQAPLKVGQPMAAGSPGAPAALGLSRSLGELPEENLQLHTHSTPHGLVLRYWLLRDEDSQPAGARDHARSDPAVFQLAALAGQGVPPGR